MIDSLDYAEIPYLQDILNYLPIDPIDEEDVNNYIQNITNLISINYRYDQYQFAYFGVHILYMTYIYSTSWKISQINPCRYKDAIVFARPYSGRDKELKIEDADSIFAYSLLPEKDISRIFKIIDLDKSQISNVCDLVDIRNDMAHATGKFEILNEDGFDAKAKNVLVSMGCINKCMFQQIRAWYSQVLLSYCAGEYGDEYKNPHDFIVEQLVQSFKLSVNELIICKEMSISSLITQHRGYESKLKKFKKAIEKYCEDMGYSEIV